jgi:uncharacterized membrane protein
MYEIIKLTHLAAAIVWMGGMAFMIWALRPAAGQLAPPQRAPLLAGVLQRFFVAVVISIAVLLLSGLYMLGAAARTVGMAQVPVGWHIMLTIGLVMFLIFGHLYFSPFRRLKKAVAGADWPEAGKRLQQIAMMVNINFALGIAAIVALRLVR